MIEEKEVQRLRRHLRAITAKCDDPDALAAITEVLSDDVAEIVAEQARSLHDRGYSWAEIARPLNITRQAAHQRYGKAVTVATSPEVPSIDPRIREIARELGLPAARDIEKRAEENRRARMDASVRYPTWCVAHRQRVHWIPAPGWWIHADNRTCQPMLAARAPEPA